MMNHVPQLDRAPSAIGEAPDWIRSQPFDTVDACWVAYTASLLAEELGASGISGIVSILLAVRDRYRDPTKGACVAAEKVGIQRRRVRARLEVSGATKIADIVNAAGGPIRFTDIATKAVAADVYGSENGAGVGIQTALKRGLITRLGKGLYGPARKSP